MEKTLTKEQVKGILMNAPKGSDPKAIIKGISDRGYQIEGLNLPKPKVQAPVQEDRGFLGNVKEDFKSRAERGGEEAYRAQTGEINPAQGALRVAGQGAAFVGDVAGEAAMSLGKTLLPKRAEEAIGSGVQKIAESKPVQATMEAYQGFKEKHPEAAKDLEAFVNIASIIPVGEGARIGSKVAGKGLTATGEALERSGIEAAESQKSKFVRELVRPEQTKAVKEAQVARTTEKGVGPFKRSVVEPTPKELRIESEISKIPEVSESNTYQQNYNIIRDANVAEAVDLEKAVKANDFVIPKREVISRLQGAKSELAKSPVLVGDAEKTADKLLAGAIDFVNKNEGKGSGLLKARKEYDKWVLSQKPKAFDAKAENAFTIANKEVRRVFNDILDESAPDVGVKESLSRQSALYDALDVIAPKAAKEADTAVMRAFQKMAEKVGLKTKVVQQIAAVAGIGGLGAAATFAPAAAGVGALTFLGYQGGKLLLKPQVRVYLGKLLKEAGGVLEAGDKAILEGLLDGELPDFKDQRGFVKNPFSTGEIPKELDSLAKEARKYKSAEEFVKARGTKFVHETNAPDIESFDITKAGENTGDSWLGRGVYFQQDGTFKLERYGKNKVEAYLSPEAKIFEIKNTPTGKWRDNFVETVSKKFPTLEQETLKDGRSLKNVLSRDFLMNKTPEQVKEYIGDYDGLIQDGELVVYNPDVIKTKSQLIDIWKKANAQ